MWIDFRNLNIEQRKQVVTHWDDDIAEFTYEFNDQDKLIDRMPTDKFLEWSATWPEENELATS